MLLLIILISLIDFIHHFILLFIYLYNFFCTFIVMGNLCELEHINKCALLKKMPLLKVATIYTTDPPSSNKPVIVKSIELSKRCFRRNCPMCSGWKSKRDHPGQDQGTTVNNTANLSMLRHLHSQSMLL